MTNITINVILVDMHIVENKSRLGKKIYRSILLRESYRENGKVKKRTIANLSNCTHGEISAIKLALKHKDDLSLLGSLKESVELEEGLSVGAVCTVYQTAKRIGLEKALGHSIEGKLALWQVIARVIEQGSRLSAVRLAQRHAACEVLRIERGFDENDLYDNLEWLSDNQEKIEKNLFFIRRGNNKPELFLYDVTSSYLEGKDNYFGEYGYSRDGKKGKKQIVIGLLCDEEGEPVSTEVFAGNTCDFKTFNGQVKKVSERFGCERVTFVGDRGMIKSAQIKDLPEGVSYITAITKPQIEALMKCGVIQMELFDNSICEVLDDGIRYILKRNPERAEDMKMTRKGKYGVIEKAVKEKNKYLSEHKRAKISTAIKGIEERIKRLKIGNWTKVCGEGRELKLQIDEQAREEEGILDGCYVIKTNLEKEVVDKQIIHDRYKDLAMVEQAFRDSKTSLLEVRPTYVRTQESTEGHVLVVMLAYMISRKLKHAWKGIDLTVKEGLKELSTVCSIKVKVKGQGDCYKIPKPRDISDKLLQALDITLPNVLPHRKVNVVTRKKLNKKREKP